MRLAGKHLTDDGVRIIESNGIFCFMTPGIPPARSIGGGAISRTR